MQPLRFVDNSTANIKQTNGLHYNSQCHINSVIARIGYFIHLNWTIQNWNSTKILSFDAYVWLHWGVLSQSQNCSFAICSQTFPAHWNSCTGTLSQWIEKNVKQYDRNYEDITNPKREEHFRGKIHEVNLLFCYQSYGSREDAGNFPLHLKKHFSVAQSCTHVEIPFLIFQAVLAIPEVAGAIAQVSGYLIASQ